MATSIQQRAGKHQLRVKHRLLPRPFFFTFATKPEAETYRDQLMKLLGEGVVPQALLAPAPRGNDPLLADLIDGYLDSQPVTDSDEPLLKLLRGEVVGLRASGVTFSWAEGYVRGLKVERNLAPGTIRKRVGALARVLDWHLLRETEKDPDNGRVNPLRLLPDGYSLYSKLDAAALKKAGKEPKVDVERDRRMHEDEEQRVALTLSGTKRGDRERALAQDPEFEMLYYLILDTGMRLREGYRLRADQVDLERGIVNVEGSKGRRGAIKPRVVPLKKPLRERLKKYMKGREGRLFPSLWDGSPEDLKRATNRLSARFATLFEYAAVDDFTEHDLRHEATCRWFLLKTPKGWVFSDLEICKIMGWTSTKMALRYLSLRGEDLANRLL